MGSKRSTKKTLKKKIGIELLMVTEIVKGGALTGITGERIARIESPQIMTENMSRRTEDHRIETEKFMIRRKREAGHVTDEDRGQGRERCRLAEERNPRTRSHSQQTTCGSPSF